jgi:hypothetical protein
MARHIDSVLSASERYTQMRQQNRMLEGIENSSIYLVENLIEYNTAFSLILVIAGILSAVCTFLIAQKGWNNIQSDYLKITFLVIFFTGGIAAIIPKVFKYKENSEQYWRQYRYYNALHQDMYDLCCRTAVNLQQVDTVKMDSCVKAYNELIRNHEDAYFNIDPSRIEEIKAPKLGP